MKTISIRVKNHISKETAEFVLNNESYLTIKPNLTTPDICNNANSENCEKCEEPECDLAQGWLPKQKEELRR